MYRSDYSAQYGLPTSEAMSSGGGFDRGMMLGLVGGAAQMGISSMEGRWFKDVRLQASRTAAGRSGGILSRELFDQKVAALRDPGVYRGGRYGLRASIIGERRPTSGLFRKGGPLGFFDDATTARVKYAGGEAERRVIKKMEDWREAQRLTGMTEAQARTAAEQAKAFGTMRKFGSFFNQVAKVQIIATVAKAGFNAFAEHGAAIRQHQGPRPWGQFNDTQQAFTMRQRSAQAIQRGQLGARRAFGNEAAALRANRG